MLKHEGPDSVSNWSYFGQRVWLIVQEGLPQLNLPKSGLSTLINVPGIGPKLTPKLFPSTLLRS